MGSRVSAPLLSLSRSVLASSRASLPLSVSSRFLSSFSRSLGAFSSPLELPKWDALPKSNERLHQPKPAASIARFVVYVNGQSRTCAITLRIDAQDTARLITIHQMHSYSHRSIRYDSSLCSIPGVDPTRCAVQRARHRPRAVCLFHLNLLKVMENRPGLLGGHKACADIGHAQGVGSTACSPRFIRFMATRF